MTDREYFQLILNYFIVKIKLISLLLAATSFLSATAQQKIPVFVSGKEDHKSYRIPAIIKLPNNDLLAFYEGSVHGSGDFGDIDIIMKRSRDHDKTEKKF